MSSKERSSDESEMTISQTTKSTGLNYQELPSLLNDNDLFRSAVITKELQEKDLQGDEPTPKPFVKKRPGRSSAVWNYVEIFPMLRELKRRHPVHFFNVYKVDIMDTDAVAIVTLSIHEGGIPVRQYIGTGTVEIQYNKQTQKPVSLGDPISGAITLAKKKAMSFAGIYPDVYGDDANKYTIADVSMKNELLDIVKSFGTTTLIKQVEDVLAPEINIDEFNRVKRDVEAIIEEYELEGKAQQE